MCFRTAVHLISSRKLPHLSDLLNSDDQLVGESFSGLRIAVCEFIMATYLHTVKVTPVMPIKIMNGEAQYEMYFQR